VLYVCINKEYSVLRSECKRGAVVVGSGRGCIIGCSYSRLVLTDLESGSQMKRKTQDLPLVSNCRTSHA